MKKRVFSIITVLVIVLAIAGCGKNNTANDNNMMGETQVYAGDRRLGLGVEVTSDGSSAEADVSGRGSTECYIAAITFDGDGRAAEVKLDCVEAEHAFDMGGAYLSDNSSAYSKRERGDDYGMRAASSIGKEWYEQVEALETWMMGKTIDEITSLDTVERDENHKAVPNDPEIMSSCTISVDGFLNAARKAMDNAK